MESRSRMAALVLAAGTLVTPLAWAAIQPAADQQAPTPAAAKPAPAEEARVRTDAQAGSQSVKLKLLIAGLSREGCDVEVKPGNRSCRFTPQAQHVGSPGELNFQFKDVEVRGADRNCTFAITVREAGQASKTIYRGFRLPAKPAQAGAKATAQTFTCYMNSPSKLAEVERSDRVRR